MPRLALSSPSATPTSRLRSRRKVTIRRAFKLTKDIPAADAAGFAGNVLAGGLIGMGVDAATGAATDHKPNPVIVTLQPKSATSSSRRLKPKPAAPPEAGT
jgi:hypothetical protein